MNKLDGLKAIRDEAEKAYQEALEIYIEARIQYAYGLHEYMEDEP